MEFGGLADSQRKCKCEAGRKPGLLLKFDLEERMGTTSKRQGTLSTQC